VAFLKEHGRTVSFVIAGTVLGCVLAYVTWRRLRDRAASSTV
jgi:hypothetical protein